MVDVRLVDDSYLSAVGVSLAEGRGVSTGDLTASDRAVVVSVAFRDRFMGEEPAVGRIIRVGGSAATVVGVARDIRFLIQDDTPDPLLYLSTPLDTPLAAPTIVLRADRPAELETSVTAALASTVSGDARVQLRWARETLDAALLPQRMGVLIVGAMGLAALFLSAVGLYGLVQFTVARQTRELGVRLALGGGRLDLAAVVLRKGLLLVGVGTVTGLAVGAVTMRGLTPFLNGISPTDPLTYGAVVTSFLFVALLASWLPARKALRIEPKEALGAE